jgi:hypothetical protein
MPIPSSIMPLLYVLLGSILTIVIGKLLDLIQKSQEHKYSLQKIFFEKKLKIAEAIVGNFQKVINVLQPISAVLTKVTDLSTTPEIGGFLTSQLQTLSSKIQNISLETNDYLQAASLYFDKIELNPVGIPSYEEVFNSILKLLLFAEKVKAITPDTPATEREKMKDEAFKFVADFKSAIDSLRTMTDKTVHDLRDEMKKYEP